jgi:uncharacterized protein
MTPMILISCTHGEDEPERSTVPFILASTAAVSGQEVAVVCTAEGAWLGTTGYAARIHFPGMAPVSELYAELVGAGGEVWLCSACTKVRGIEEEDLAEGARIVGAAQIVEAVAEGGRWVSLT